MTNQTYRLTLRVAGPTLADIEIEATSVAEAIGKALEANPGAFTDHRMEETPWAVVDVYDAQGETAWATGDPIPFLGPEGAPKILAEIHSDDRVYEVPFEANFWFAKASDEDILGLAGEGWGFNYASDRVAEACEEAFTDIKALYHYLYLKRNSHAAPGSDVSVDAQQAVAWLKVHRPELATKFDEDGDLLEEKT